MEGNWRRRGVGECRLWLVSLRRGDPNGLFFGLVLWDDDPRVGVRRRRWRAAAPPRAPPAAGASASSDELESSSSSSSSSLSSSVLESGGESGGLGMGFAPGLLAKRRLGLSGVCLRGGEGRSGSQLADAVRPAADAVPRGRELGAVAAGTGLGPGSVLDAFTRCASFFPRVFCQPAPRSLVAAADPGCSLRMCATSARSVLKPALARLRLHPLTLHLCGLSTESLAPLGDADACASPRSSHVRRGRSSLGGAAGDVARLTTSKLPSALGVMRTPGPRGMPLLRPVRAPPSLPPATRRLCLCRARGWPRSRNFYLRRRGVSTLEQRKTRRASRHRVAKTHARATDTLRSA